MLPWIRFLIKHCEEVNGKIAYNNYMTDFHLINLLLNSTANPLHLGTKNIQIVFSWIDLSQFMVVPIATDSDIGCFAPGQCTSPCISLMKEKMYLF